MNRFACRPRVAYIFLAALMTVPLANAEEPRQVVAAGTIVSLFYVLSIDGEILEDNNGKEPLIYSPGNKQLLPALENELLGMRVGDRKSIRIAARDAYGEYEPEETQEVPLVHIPEEERFVGANLQIKGYPGAIYVREVREDVAVVDFNHRFAGKELLFDVHIAEIVGADEHDSAGTLSPAN